jgi:uncharacterized membrane protein
MTDAQRRLYPGLTLAGLDLLGLVVATYLAVTALTGGLPSCGPLHGCEDVARSSYSRIGGIPVAVLGVLLSTALLGLAVAWTRTGRTSLLAGHYGLSLLGVVFEVYFVYVEVVLIGAVCVWCTIYGASLVARFLVALRLWTVRT